MGAQNVESFDAGRVPVERVIWSLPQEVKNLQEFDIGIMPLESTPWEDAKCGFKLLQYMATGVPCVASPVAENRFIIENNVSGFVANSTEAWVSKLGMLLRDSNLRQKMGDRGRQRVEEHYSLRVVSQDFLQVIRAVLEE